MADESSFAQMMESQTSQGRTRRLRAGDVVEVTIIQIAQDSIFVDVGTPSDGRIARSEFADKEGNVRVKVGDRIRATVLDPRPDGPLLATSLGHGDKLDISALEMARTSGTPVEGEIVKVNKGGVEVSLANVRAFCPASQLELSRVGDLESYVGQKLEFRVIEVRDGGRSIVVSRRSLLEDRRKAAAEGARERLVIGSDVEGVVQSLSRHGAVVDLDGVEGFIHVSELAAGRVERAEDVVQVGERVTARVLSVDDSPKGLRIRLSLRALSNTSAAAGAAQPPAPVEDVLKGVVTRTGQHGVFVQTPIGEGLVPLRELGLPPGADHRRAYPVGKELAVVVVSRAGGRLTLSSTQVARVEERKNYREFSGSSSTAPTSSFGSLGDMLRKFQGTPAVEAAAAPAAKPAVAKPTAPAAPTGPASDVTRRRRDVR
jgi:small subunit ribosomal protein S1